MSRAWTLTLLTGSVTIALKGAGVLVTAYPTARRRASRLIEQITPVLLPTVLTALIVTQVFSAGRHLTLDARAAGFVAALLGTRLGLQPVLVLATAAAATAAVRLIRS
jgi:hypothetical protein